jgi:hypothetical protein
MYVSATLPDFLVRSRSHDSHVKPLNQPNSNPLILAIHTGRPDN